MGLTRLIIIALGLGLLSECDFLLVMAIKKTKKKTSGNNFETSDRVNRIESINFVSFISRVSKFKYLDSLEDRD